MSQADQTLIQDVHWDIAYKVKLGRAWSRFMRGLQNKELLGTTCASCDRTYVPAQDYCEMCYEPIAEWKTLEPVGTLRAVTIVYQGFDGGPEVPYSVGAIEIDGTNSLFIHFLGGLDLSDSKKALAVLKNGARLTAVWSDDRTAAITDIAYFTPAE